MEMTEGELRVSFFSRTELYSDKTGLRRQTKKNYPCLRFSLMLFLSRWESERRQERWTKIYICVVWFGCCVAFPLVWDLFSGWWWEWYWLLTWITAIHFEIIRFEIYNSTRPSACKFCKSWSYETTLFLATQTVFFWCLLLLKQQRDDWWTPDKG